MAVFKETQCLTPVIRWVAMIITAVFVIIGILGAVKGISEDGWISLAVSLFVGPIAVALILFMRLDLKLTSKRITYRLFPLEWKEKQIDISEIESFHIHKLAMFGNFGGFGKRRRPLKKQIAYIMNRNYGMTVRMKNGKSKVFSIENEKKLEGFLKKNYSSCIVK